MAPRAIQDLIGPSNQCYGCGPDNPEGLRIKSFWDGDETICTWQPRPAFMAGPTDVLNGGVIATLLDCHAVGTAIAHTYRLRGREIGSEPRVWCVTASMSVEYLKATPIAAPVSLRGRVEKVGNRSTTVACTLSAGGLETARALVVAVRVQG